jgi:two-component system KDP operon response regulator KdpE
MANTILVVDDQGHIRRMVRDYLEAQGFRVVTADNGRQALYAARHEKPDLILLDIMMPEMDGFETLRKVRAVSAVPVIFLSVKGEETDRVAGLDLGADDYITKPFGPKELVSRIKAVLRRTEPEISPRQSEIEIDKDLKINFDERKVFVRGKEVKLRATEYRLLYQLVTNAGKLMTHDILLSRVWGPEYRDEDQYVRLYITYLRQKIEPDPKKPRYILSERGLGYRFVDFSNKTHI